MADAHHGRALFLTLALDGVDGLADVGHGQVVGHRDGAGFPGPGPAPPLPCPTSQTTGRTSPMISGPTVPVPMSSPAAAPKRFCSASAKDIRASPHTSAPSISRIWLGRTPYTPAPIFRSWRFTSRAAACTARPMRVVERLEPGGAVIGCDRGIRPGHADPLQAAVAIPRPRTATARCGPPCPHLGAAGHDGGGAVRLEPHHGHGDGLAAGVGHAAGQSYGRPGLARALLPAAGRDQPLEGPGRVHVQGAQPRYASLYAALEQVLEPEFRGWSMPRFAGDHVDLDSRRRRWTGATPMERRKEPAPPVWV